MRKSWRGRFVKLVPVAVAMLALVGCMALESNAGAVTSSNNYQVIDTGFGNSDTTKNCSSQYCAQTGVGGLTSGNTSGDNGSATIGPVTGSEPLLDVIVEGGQSDLGILTTELTATKTTVVKVRNYLSAGYVIQITGDPPKYGGHSLAALEDADYSVPGVEQFGINLVANTSPNVGANPVQVPSTETSFGEAVGGYNETNKFKYVNGDIVARSPKSSGQTDYTITMILNISNLTPAGRYFGDFSAVVVPVY